MTTAARAQWGFTGASYAATDTVHTILAVRDALTTLAKHCRYPSGKAIKELVPSVSVKGLVVIRDALIAAGESPSPKVPKYHNPKPKGVSFGPHRQRATGDRQRRGLDLAEASTVAERIERLREARMAKNAAGQFPDLSIEELNVVFPVEQP